MQRREDGANCLCFTRAVKTNRAEDSPLLLVLRSAISFLAIFNGLRERVLKRDQFGCRACGASAPLVVHHRARRNEARLLVTLCAGCHMRLHHSYGFRHWLSGTLLRLWRELHQRDPVQLQLSLKTASKQKHLGGVQGSQNASTELMEDLDRGLYPA